jgi:CDP-diacylglycerol pyrophosphatase
MTMAHDTLRRSGNEVGDRPGWLLAAASLALVLAAAPAAAANRDQLRVIAEAQCAPHWAQAHEPAPCLRVIDAAPGHSDSGYVILHDITGGAHYLMIPTTTMAGIESREILAATAPNWYQAAWQARDALEKDVGVPVPDEAVALAVNSALARTQDQLHIHISCQQSSIHEALDRLAPRIGTQWTPVFLGTGTYDVRRVMGESLAQANPFRLLAEHLPRVEDMGRYSLMVAGMRFKEGPGFIVIAGTGVPGSAMLLDPGCAMVKRARH